MRQQRKIEHASWDRRWAIYAVPRALRFLSAKGRPAVTWSLLALERVKWQGKDALAPGKNTLVFDWKYAS